MRLHLTPLVLTALCSLGLQACFIGPESPTDPEGKRTTLSLHRLDNGNLEYCDENGECQEVPYDGDCAVVEVDVDTSTGQTCERCVMDDGEVIDQGCGDVSVGCVVVTLPDPDCVVCAYVNGDVLFSSCVVAEPECSSDADCRQASGHPAACIDGQCVEGPGCRGDDECPPGFFCAFDQTNDLGTCIPREPEPECRSDFDCPAGMRCEQLCDCWGTDPAGTDSNTGDAAQACDCRALCVPIEPPPPPECLSDADCPQGQICQLEHFCPQCEDGEPCPAGPCEVFGFCVEPIPGECGPNQPCPDGMACEEICECWAGEPTPDDGTSNGDAMPPEECRCYAMCVPVEPPPHECRADADCPAGLICQLTYACPACEDNSAGCSDMPCYEVGICVEPWHGECQSDADCPADMMCMVACWDCAPGDVDCLGGCEGYCVPREPEPECRSDQDCPNGFCEFGYQCDGLGCTEPAAGFCVFPNCDDGSQPLCDMIPPVCAPGEVLAVQNNCWACLDARTCRGQDPYCASDADCAPGEVCESICDCWNDPTTDPNGSGVAPCECYGVCVPGEPPPTECRTDDDCPDGLVCQVESYCPPCEDNGEPCPAMPCYQGGVCVEPQPTDECRSDADCPEGTACVTACWDCLPEDPNCQGGCFSYCAQTDPPVYECRTDEDCLTADGRAGRCEQGVCQF